MKLVDKMAPKSGRALGEGDKVINTADAIDTISKSILAGITLGGRGVIETSLITAVAVTSTTQQSSPIVNISNVSGRKYIHVTNSHNQACTIYLKVRNKAGTATVSLGSAVVQPLSSRTITIADIPALTEPLQNIQIDFAFATAPTSGSISAWVEGVSA
ncbi:hypothetical protein [Bacillus sp. Au-Bac7]|uniref:hypothetical protein n=1 Tax=Bacillus sp. Au-Bac7 TaxID=2906458 RepID=UPI001E4EB026|nr:hypothetical protein [Bacillus sp. Au-Bac7]MCE4052033.1 hypothetical protein [Bacillus sp. Au-Bac7]